MKISRVSFLVKNSKMKTAGKGLILKAGFSKIRCDKAFSSKGKVQGLKVWEQRFQIQKKYCLIFQYKHDVMKSFLS